MLEQRNGIFVGLHVLDCYNTYISHDVFVPTKYHR